MNDWESVGLDPGGHKGVKLRGGETAHVFSNASKSGETGSEKGLVRLG